jgi:hypothetical protein
MLTLRDGGSTSVWINETRDFREDGRSPRRDWSASSSPWQPEVVAQYFGSPKTSTHVHREDKSRASATVLNMHA